MSLLDTPSDIANKIEKTCKELNSASTVFHLKDFNKLLKNQENEGGELETCEGLLTKLGSGQDKTTNPHGTGKGKGKQKSGKTVSSANVVKVIKVRIPFLF